MKPKSHRALALGLLTAGSIIVSGNASATILIAGYHNFNDQSGIQSTPDYSHIPAFTSSVDKGSVASSPTGGSNDGTYGTSSLISAGSDDGFVNLLSFASTRFSVTNGTGSGRALETLLFDFAGADNSQTLATNYIITSGGTPIGGGALSSVTSNTVFGPASNPASYESHALDLTGISLNAGETIQFTFTGANGGFDNIGLLAVPEPASLMALGCVLGSGLLLRTRSRRPLVPGAVPA